MTRTSEWILTAGFIFLVVWPFVVMDFGIWAFVNLVVVGLVAWAYRAAPNDSRVKSMFGVAPRNAKIQTSEGLKE